MSRANDVAYRLLTEDHRHPASDLPALPNRAGICSWWVDEEGARDLSQALCLQVEPGLIDAHEVGATAWPSGKRSTDTLRQRIRQVLDGKSTGSSTRLSLGCVLYLPLGMHSLDDPELTEWMLAHLSVSFWQSDDRDELMDLMGCVMLFLDPPFNIDPASRTEIRKAIRGRRRSPYAEDPGLRLRRMSKQLREAGQGRPGDTFPASSHNRP